jgi:hypothetical protein
VAKFGWGKATALAAGAIVAGAAWFYLKEKRVETPTHETLLTDGSFALRHYPAMLVAETVQAGNREQALRQGFGLLADYFFAESRGGAEIAMTAPVLADQVGAQWRVRFIIPAGLTRESLPMPGEGVRLDELNGADVAVISFGGRVTDAILATKAAELAEWVAAQELRVVGEAAGGFIHAFYNSPLLPGPLRHNEIWLII